MLSIFLAGTDIWWPLMWCEQKPPSLCFGWQGVWCLLPGQCVWISELCISCTSCASFPELFGSMPQLLALRAHCLSCVSSFSFSSTQIFLNIWSWIHFLAYFFSYSTSSSYIHRILLLLPRRELKTRWPTYKITGLGLERWLSIEWQLFQRIQLKISCTLLGGEAGGGSSFILCDMFSLSSESWRKFSLWNWAL